MILNQLRNIPANTHCFDRKERRREAQLNGIKLATKTR